MTSTTEKPNLSVLVGKYGMARRWGTEADQIEAKRNLAAGKIEAFIQRTLEDVPPLTTDQREHLAALLMGGEK
jgi:hypothetical protein